MSRMPRSLSRSLRRKALWYWVVERGQKRCAYCSKQLHYTHLHPQQATIEHIIPRSKKGEDKLYNILLCCLKCNRERSNKSFRVFVQGLPKEEWLLRKYEEALQNQGE